MTGTERERTEMGVKLSGVSVSGLRGMAADEGAPGGDSVLRKKMLTLSKKNCERTVLWPPSKVMMFLSPCSGAGGGTNDGDRRTN